MYNIKVYSKYKNIKIYLKPKKQKLKIKSPKPLKDSIYLLDRYTLLQNTHNL